MPRTAFHPRFPLPAGTRSSSWRDLMDSRNLYRKRRGGGLLSSSGLIRGTRTLQVLTSSLRTGGQGEVATKAATRLHLFAALRGFALSAARHVAVSRQGLPEQGLFRAQAPPLPHPQEDCRTVKRDMSSEFSKDLPLPRSHPHEAPGDDPLNESANAFSLPLHQHAEETGYHAQSGSVVDNLVPIAHLLQDPREEIEGRANHR